MKTVKTTKHKIVKKELKNKNVEDHEKAKKIKEAEKHVFNVVIELGKPAREARRLSALIGKILEYYYVLPTKLNNDIIFNYIVHKNVESPILISSVRSLISKIKFIMSKAYGIEFTKDSGEIIRYLKTHIDGFNEKQMNPRDQAHYLRKRKIRNEKTHNKFSIKSIVDAVKKRRIKRGCDPDTGKNFLV